MLAQPSTAKDAYETLSQLARALRDPEERDAARERLFALAAWAETQPEDAPLRLATIDVAIADRQERLRLLLLPSIFAPEAWAYTFLEGLLRIPSEAWEGKSLVEIGTGSGWIPIALSKLTPLRRIVGLDLNPHSEAVAICNLWLNCSEEEASRLDFAQSDLLSALPSTSRWDYIVGCIPQVLSDALPDSLDDADEQALYDLSNYTAIQNVYEDHFGLGLIAKLLDDCPEYLAPGGELVLNLAGRPGRAIIERMFSRRGFRTEVLVSRRVRQAGDTDIAPLVALEQSTRSEFEFYMTQHSAEPIRAETALGWMSKGHPIWHEVAVWRARLGEQREVLALRRALRELKAEKLLDEVDLGDASQEKLNFVAALVSRLGESALLPYPHEAGDPSFRQLVCRYLARFFDLHLDEGEVFVGPEREQTVHSLLLATCDPGDTVLVSRSAYPIYERALQKAGVRAIVTNDTLRETHRLLDAFDPKLVLLTVGADERSNWSELLAIADAAAQRGAWVCIDESAFFNITSGVEAGTLFELLSKEAHRPNLVVLYGLIKNAVFPDLELSLLLPVPQGLASDLEVAAELTYSRISAVAEWYYAHLFAELLSFRISFAAEEGERKRRVPLRPLLRSRRIERAAAAPAFAPKVFREDDERTIRLDYGENESPIAPTLREGLIAACLAPMDAPPPALQEGIAAFLATTRGIEVRPERVLVSQGVWPLMYDTVVGLRAVLGRAPRIFLATPCYGLIPPTLEAAGAEIVSGPLEGLFAQDGPKCDAVLVSQPNNPLGTFLSERDLERLVDWARRRDAWILSDEIFGLLDLRAEREEKVASPAALPGGVERTLIFGGLSKEFAAGGLRVGWVSVPSDPLADAIREASLSPPHLVAARAAAHLYGAWKRGPGGSWLHPERREELLAYLEALRKELAEKRATIAEIFSEEALSSPDPAGLFLAPRIEAWLGKEVGGERLTPENLPRILYEQTGVVVNGGDWTGDRERIRLVFSIPGDSLREAARRLADFAASL